MRSQTGQVQRKSVLPGCVKNRVSGQASAIVRRGLTGGLAKGGGEGARRAEAERHAYLRHGVARFRQQRLGVLDATAAVIVMRWNTERLLERPAEIMGAQAHKACQCGERYLLDQVLLDVVGDDPLLPGREPAADRQFDAR